MKRSVFKLMIMIIVSIIFLGCIPTDEDKDTNTTVSTTNLVNETTTTNVTNMTNTNTVTNTMNTTNIINGESDNVLPRFNEEEIMDNYSIDDNAKDGVYLTFAHSGYNIAPRESVNLHPNGSYKSADVDNWTEKAIATISYTNGTQIEVFASKMWWGGDRCPMDIEFLDASYNTIGSINFNPTSYSGNAVYFYRNGDLVYTHDENNQSIEDAQYDGKLYGTFQFINSKIKFDSYHSAESFGTDFELNYDLSNVKYIRCTTQALGTYYEGRALSYTKLLNETADPTPLLEVVAGTSTITGKVQDAITGDPIVGATIKLSQNGIPLATVETDASGIYTLSNLAGESGYSLEVSKTDYLPVNYVDIQLEEGVTKHLETVMNIEDRYAGLGDISGKITNSVDGNGVSGLLIQLREGINTHTGRVVQTSTTGDDGYYSVTGLEAGSYTAEITGDGYQTAYMTVVVLGGELHENQNGSINPILSEGEIRIVLTWGESPNDLDSHLTGPIEGSSDRFHVYWMNEGSSDSTNLDVDDTSSYGPETITIVNQVSGVYRYSVHDYSNRGSSSSSALGNSGANVKVYKGSGLVAEFFVPNEGGTLWTVFEIDGNIITSINRMEYYSDYDTIQKVSYIKKK